MLGAGGCAASPDARVPSLGAQEGMKLAATSLDQAASATEDIDSLPLAPSRKTHSHAPKHILGSKKAKGQNSPPIFP